MPSKMDVTAMFSGRIERINGNYKIKIPDREIELGTLVEGETYRIALLNLVESTSSSNDSNKLAQSSEPPVNEGDQIEVEIEDMGEQGDGIARVGPGFIIFVEDAKLGDRVTVEIRKVLDNYGFAKVIEPEPIAD